MNSRFLGRKESMNIMSYRSIPAILKDNARKFKNEIIEHPLRREIITNYIVNTIINRIGINFILNLMEKSGTSVEDIIYAYFIIRDSYRLRDIWHDAEY